MEAARLPIPTIRAWTLTEHDIDVLIELRRNLDQVLRVILVAGGEPGNLSEQILLLDRFLGPRGGTCEVPRR